MANLNVLAGQLLGQNVTRLLEELQLIVDNLESHRRVLEMLKNQETSLDQVQLLEGGGIRVNPEYTPGVCDPYVAERFGHINGQEEALVDG